MAQVVKLNASCALSTAPSVRSQLSLYCHTLSAYGQQSTLSAGIRPCNSNVLRLDRSQRMRETAVSRGRLGPGRVRGAIAVAQEGANLPEALLFDCDGVLVDTERDGHRVSFNKAFQEAGLDVDWGVDLYGELLKIGGGKERMTHYFDQVGWPKTAPVDPETRKHMIAQLHRRKTQLFMDMVDTGALPLRDGVARLVDEALSNGVKVAVCSTSNEKAVSAIVSVMLGPERAAQMQIFAGDVVPKKKPDPAIYNLAATTLGVNPSRCVVVEDSHIGLTAAKAAGMTCVVTKSGYTADENFSVADAVYDCIGGDEVTPRFGIADLVRLLSAKATAW